MILFNVLECFAYWKGTPFGGFRWGTLIVANGDERIVGNAVLKNPGSAAPVESLFGEREDGRVEFSLDPTMEALADLFCLGRTGGTVRLFNLSDVRDVDPRKALTQLDEGSFMDEDVAEQIASVPGVPTYLGWGGLWHHPSLSERARRIFTTALPDSPYLAQPMESNAFFHPLYLMRYGRNREECWRVIQEFRKCLK